MGVEASRSGGDLDLLQSDLVLSGVVERQLRSPVAQAARMRSSERARWRYRSSNAAIVGHR